MQQLDLKTVSFTQADLDAIWQAAATQGGTRAAVLNAAEGRMALKMRLGAELTIVRTEWRDAAAKALEALKGFTRLEDSYRTGPAEVAQALSTAPDAAQEQS